MRNNFAQRRGIAVAHEIHPAKLHRVHAQALGDHVSLAFGREKRLQMARRAHVTAGHLIGINVIFFDQTIRHAIGSGRIVGADEIALRPIGAVSTAIEDELNMLRDQDAVFLDSGLDLDHRAVARIAGDQFLGIIN